MTDASRLDDIDELGFVEGLPQTVSTTFDPDRWENVERARRMGFDALSGRDPGMEGAAFLDIGGDVWILGLRGAQFLHNDRHMVDKAPGNGGHTWTAVIDADHAEAPQTLVVMASASAWAQTPLDVGRLVYFNTYQPHLVARGDADDVSVMVQVGGIGPDEPERALAAMAEAVARLQPRR